MKAIFAVFLIVTAIFFAAPNDMRPEFSIGAWPDPPNPTCNSVSPLIKEECPGVACPNSVKYEKIDPGTSGFWRTVMVRTETGDESCKADNIICDERDDDEITESPCEPFLVQ